MLRFLLFLLCVSRVLAKDTERCQGKDCEIKTWHNKNCRTNDDCNQPLAVCYENQCRCDPGYYYTTNDTCTSTCSTGELQSNFTEYPDSAIRGNHLDRINGISLEYCKGRCQTLRRCLTFDFKANGGQCRFHNVTAREAPSDWSPKTSTGWTHYQRSCKSTLATDDNWYNLLCNSRINCPDPNSDCLSGRCFCQLGFNFNEAMKKCVTSVLKTWHNASCGTDDDCDEPHGVCYKRVCRCHPGYYYTTQDTCTSTCSTGELQSNFTEYPDSALRGNLLDVINGISVEDCKGKCQADNRCLTFDFKAHGGLCRLHNVTAHESPSDWYPKRSKGWTHYQRSCKSTFASHDNWYNLLCNSGIDCYDRNSDCLSGRCFCQSGFKFNEAEMECRAPSELKTWHNTSCGTDDDCDEPHGVCYKRVCRCHPGYYYTTQDTCTSTCSRGELQSNFTEYPDSALRGNHLASSDRVSVDVCKGRCLADNRCLTFDFKGHGGLCRLHHVTALESSSDWSPKTSKGWTHYQRSCKSPFASNDTWYNLLCDSKIACPDRNSDCLSGRCMCHSGFKFNEATKKCVVTSELKTWHNTSCGTDDDCDEPHGVCYKHLCRCHPGYYYTTQDTCTSTCSRGEVQSNFTEYPDSALRGNHLASSDGVSVDVCKGRCLADNRCLTFDFKAHGGLCRLHNVTAHESLSHWFPKTSKGWTHYQRSCKSTFASHRTWYNLLCHSGIDCPDTNSDCLSGRCFCHSSFKFNEATKKCVVTSELKTWHNTSCGTDDDCDEPHGVCYKRVCRCDPGYYYTTQDTCTNTCSRGELQSNFTEYPDSALRGNHLASSDRVSVDVCKGRCKADNRCLTFDFKAHGGLCRLHNVTGLESPSDWYPKTSKGWTHYQRSCKSTFASHRTWYNLLCNSGIDCPDRNSDCLSGRCMCHSGFKFNEAMKKCVITRKCEDWQDKDAKSGVYTIHVFDNKPVKVWCDMDTAGGGWVVFQRFGSGSVSFNRNWTEYENGFGDLSGEFWLGLSTISPLTREWARLRVDLMDMYEKRYWAEYATFVVRGPDIQYSLSLLNSNYSGNAGDALRSSDSYNFSTYDRDQYGCRYHRRGGWWYPPDCGFTNLNIGFWAYIDFVKFSEMKMKPLIWY